MEHQISKEEVVACLVKNMKEVQQSLNQDDEILITSKPGADFIYMDSQILIAITGMIAVDLEIDIPNSCHLFLGKNQEQLSIDQAADKVLSLITKGNGSR